MAITREALEQRLEGLKRDRDQMQANLNAYMGAISDVEYWLSQLDADVPAESPNNGRIPEEILSEANVNGH